MWLLVLCVVVVAAVAVMRAGRLLVFDHPTDPDAQGRYKRPPGLNVIITGSTRGIGLALAKEFLALGDNVVISSRRAALVDEVVADLTGQFPKAKVVGCAADVTSEDSLCALAAFGKQHLGGIDIWINNAGVTQTYKTPVHKTPESVLRAVVDTNLVGTLLGCKVAINAMLEEPQRKGHVFNMDGAGANGMSTPNFAVYGATKAALPQLMKSLVKETAGTNVGIHTLSPGMVLTDLLMSGNREPRVLKVFNILAERPRTVAQWLVPRIRAASGSGLYIKFLTAVGAAWRFATFFRRKNRFFDAQGVLKHE